MSASAKRKPTPKTEPQSSPNPLRKYTRGERRNAARELRKQLAADGQKHSFREVWERAYRFPIVPASGTDLLGNLAQTMARFVVRHIVTPCGRLVHPTKGWRGKNGLPLGHKVHSS